MEAIPTNLDRASFSTYLLAQTFNPVGIHSLSKSFSIYLYLFSFNSAPNLAHSHSPPWLHHSKTSGFLRDACVTRTKLYRLFSGLKVPFVFIAVLLVNNLTSHSTCRRFRPKALLEKRPASSPSTRRPNPITMGEPRQVNELL